MKKVLKWIALLLGGLVTLLLVAALALMIAGNARLNRTHSVKAETINILADETALARGEHLVDVFCSGCHGRDLRGQLMLDDPALGIINTANITGVAEGYSDEELIVAIRHGIGRDGRYLMIMPVDSHIYFSEGDLGAIIAYLKTIPRAGSIQQTRQVRPIGRILAGLGALDMIFPAASMNHDLPFPEMPEVGASRPYGEYLARHCQGCHGPELTGGVPPDPAAPPAPNLTPNGPLRSWTEEGFITTLRTGVTPSGHELQSAMPWESYAKLDDAELRALWMYLSSMEPPASTGNET
jgi:mono/diheme cytochrome c family protein